MILRGGASGTNYDADSVAEVAYCLREQNLAEQLMVDCSHGNSRKDYRNQPLVARALAKQVEEGSRAVASLMIESNLVEGGQKHAQRLEDLVYGQSITDQCIGWDDTVEVLDLLAAAVRKRRALAETTR
jgi:3-deoxy-7-phosphoheptulonate synthase